jgi:nitrogen fixation protein NifQ
MTDSMTHSDSLERFWLPIVQQYLLGNTALPSFLGLEEADYYCLIDTLGISDNDEIHTLPARQIRSELLAMRSDECQQVYDLLYQHIASSTQHLADEAEMMAQVITAGCMSSSHLWHDLGLPERPRLSQLFGYYFPTLKQLNDKNMRWKRFLYKQLCENGGDYVCRAPSCEACTSYAECFVIDSMVTDTSSEQIN